MFVFFCFLGFFCFSDKEFPISSCFFMNFFLWFLGTSCSPTFTIFSPSYTILLTVALFTSTALARVLILTLLSALTCSTIFETFSGVYAVAGRPERFSSSTLSRPSKNRLCH
uniref:Uncharacterized protein n=1 Tax=Cacopsylla melanoneura TaxID=428564 RepID=A0A8D8WQY9_9HEMI